MTNKPFIKLFNTIDKFYFFDVNTTSIIKINEQVYNYLESTLTNNVEYDVHLDNQLNTLKSRGFLKPNDPNVKIAHNALPLVDEMVKGNVRQLILQVTQNCNLRCKYCVYSGSYMNRVHTNKRMSFDVAKRAIDFYYKHNWNKNLASIGFYGGEPLLEMKLIKQIVEYCKDLFAGKMINFNMTTNATLLNDDIIKYLYDNNFIVTISLDGPQQVHDGSRVFADNETGTFDSIMKNLERVNEMYPKFMENISFNAVLDTSNDFKCSSDFFSYEFMKNALVTATTLNDNNNKDEISYTEGFDINYRYETFKCYLKGVGKYKGEKISKLAMQQLNSLKVDVHEKISTPYFRTNSCHPSGPCIGGVLRLFVNVDGEFYPCERVSESCEAFKIGSLDDGFKTDKIKDLLNIGSLTPEQCKNCWAIYFCTGCASGLEDGNVLSPKKRLVRCESIRKGCIVQFKEYCTLRELGYKFE